MKYIGTVTRFEANHIHYIIVSPFSRSIAVFPVRWSHADLSKNMIPGSIINVCVRHLPLLRSSCVVFRTAQVSRFGWLSEEFQKPCPTSATTFNKRLDILHSVDPFNRPGLEGQGQAIAKLPQVKLGLLGCHWKFHLLIIVWYG